MMLRRLPGSTLGLLTFLLLPTGEIDAQDTARAAADSAQPATSLPALPIPDTLLEQLGLRGVDLDTIHAGPFDNGKMWTLEHPPLDYFEEEYGFRPDSAWLRRARLGALRIPGCTASFVSPHGLVLTNHHCARDAVARIAREGERLVDEGFYAAEGDGERRADDLHADLLVEIVDVTDRIYAALDGVADEEARGQARDSATSAVEDSLAQARGGEEEGAVVEVISLYQGARYSAYVFHRYDDVRVVLAPELEIGHFGGDPDNFTYPRHSLDFTFLRVYGEDGSPLEVEHHFSWSPEGASPGDPVFVIGNPGTTSRLQTVTQLLFRRDVSDRATWEFIRRRADAYRTYLAENPEADPSGEVNNTLLSLLNSLKNYRGMLDGLHDPGIMARRLDLELQVRDSIRGDPAFQAEYGHVFDRLAEIQSGKREFRAEFEAFLGLTSKDYEAAVLQRALWALQHLLVQRQGGSEDDLRSLAATMDSVPDHPPALQELLVAARLREYVGSFGEESQIVRQALGGRSPEVAAASVVQGSVLADSSRAARALEDGSLTTSDPAIRVIIAAIQPFVRFQQRLSQLQSREEELNADLGRARYRIYGTSVPPDATFSLRVADGVVRGYPYNGTLAPPHTTYYGLYDHYHSYGGTEEASEWALPERWLSPPASFDLSTPLNFVSTADIIGGNSGSPVLNRDLELVGLIFDGNIESLSGDYIYLPAKNRAVAVDARGILEAVEEIYGAHRIARELLTGELVETEAAAEAMGPVGR